MLNEGPPLPGGGSGIPVNPTAARVCTARGLIAARGLRAVEAGAKLVHQPRVITKLCATVKPASISGASVGPALTLPVGAFCTSRFL